MPAIFRLLAAATLALFVSAAALAQTPARLDNEALRQEIGRIEAQLLRPGQTDFELQALRTRMEPIFSTLVENLARETPRLEEINARLTEIGPKPDAKAPSESAEVARSREEQEKLKKEVDENIRVNRLLLVRVEQIQSSITDKRRALFRQAILERSQSIVSPWLWLDAIKALPHTIEDIQAFMKFRFRQIANRAEPIRLGAIAVMFALIIAAWVPLSRLLRRAAELPEDVKAPTRRQRAWYALRRAVSPALLPLAAALAVFGMQEQLELGNDRLGELARTVILSWPILAFLHALSIAVLEPDAGPWRIIPVGELTARRIGRFLAAAVWVVVIGKAVEAISQAVSAALPLSVAAKGIVALLVGGLLLLMLRRVEEPDAGKAEDAGAAPSSLRLFVRLGCWVSGLAILGGALGGFIALAGFLTDQVIWITVIGVILTLLLMLVDELIGKGLSSDTEIGRQFRTITGLTTGSVQQISILGSGLARLLLFATAAMLALAPWGVDSGDMIGSLRAAFFGFQVGGVTISLSTIAIALALFFVGAFITRSIQGWLEGTYLPSTGLDIGLQNSIKTIFGYVGFVVALFFAMGYAGLSLDKVTLVAGALSVGIGFGLQSIVNNFVSGLILLWERPIRVGDWIVVGEEQGKVRRINVRATEIETFDKASLIVPNSEFISGRVKNWMHHDRMGRIIIPVGVSYGSDPEAVRKLLLDVALAHLEVLSQPAPIVFFMKLGDSSLDFELRCFADVDAIGTTRSELLFEIFRRLKSEGIDVPFPRRTVELADIDRLGRTIAENIPPR